jgi:hypothetical protein
MKLFPTPEMQPCSRAKALIAAIPCSGVSYCSRGGSGRIWRLGIATWRLGIASWRLGTVFWRLGIVGGDSGIASGSESDGESGCEEAIVKSNEMREKWVEKWEVRRCKQQLFWISYWVLQWYGSDLFLLAIYIVIGGT